MRLALIIADCEPGMKAQVERAREAERLGYDSVWTTEGSGTDVITPLAWMAAHTGRIKLGTGILQIGTRTPAMTAMTAMTLDLLSGGRFLLGLGMSGPRLIEGFHGQPYGSAVPRTREVVQIIRSLLEGNGPVEFHGRYYDLPLKGGTGLGRPFQLAQKPLRPHLPIYLAAIGPKNVALAAEIADGWMPVFYSPEHATVFSQSLADGAARSGRAGLPDLDISPTVNVVLGDDAAACRAQLRPLYAHFIGGAGARSKNFYNELIARYGYAAEARQIQELYLNGEKQAAAAAVPDDLIDQTALCGPRSHIAERLAAWRQAGVTTLHLGTTSVEAMRVMAELAL